LPVVDVLLAVPAVRASGRREVVEDRFVDRSRGSPDDGRRDPLRQSARLDGAAGGTRQLELDGNRAPGLEDAHAEADEVRCVVDRLQEAAPTVEDLERAGDVDERVVA